MGDKPQWSNEQVKCLLDTCIEEVNKIGIKGSNMHVESWVTLRKALKEKFYIDTSQKLLKNAFDNLKAKCGHPKVGSLRTRPLPYPILCESLFDGSSASGSIKWTSTQTTPTDTSSSSHRVQRLLIDDNPFDDTSARAPSDKAHGGSTYRPDKRAKTTDASTDRPDNGA
uniref:Myb/SANT-like domain-containing protein n=1 Tax=Lactuca sativa TaxID=4236 RepID=A0A9R1XA29_LACSA|nr:hypothetical protein LSAT_V11C500258810 [Lactuca sativa]